MAESTPIPLTASSVKSFPTLTPTQFQRFATHGRARHVRSGEVLVELGDKDIPIFVVTSGELEAVRPSFTQQTLIRRFGPGNFTGEINTLSGRRAFARIRARADSEVVEITRQNLLALVQTDAELGEIVMRAFILRRAELFAKGLGDATLVGSSHSADTLRIKEFFTRNGHPYTFVDVERDDDVQSLLDHFHIAVVDTPVVICRGEAVLRNPTNREIAYCLGFNETVDETRVRDLVIVGAGPAGLASAVYGASEGLDVLQLGLEPGGSVQHLLQEDRSNSIGFHFEWQPRRMPLDLRGEYARSSIGSGYWAESAYRLSDLPVWNGALRRVQIVGRMQQFYIGSRPDEAFAEYGLPESDAKQAELGANYLQWSVHQACLAACVLLKRQVSCISSLAQTRAFAALACLSNTSGVVSA